MGACNGYVQQNQLVMSDKPPPIKRKRLAPQVLNLLNYKNQSSKEGITWPRFINEQTGEIGEDCFFNFPVGASLYFEWFASGPGKSGYTYYRVSRWHRYRPLLFNVDVMTLQVNKGLKKAIAIKAVNDKKIAGIFDLPGIEYQYMLGDARDMRLTTSDANLLDFYEFQKHETPKSEQITEERFKACFQAFLESMLHPQSVDLENTDALHL